MRRYLFVVLSLCTACAAKRQAVVTEDPNTVASKPTEQPAREKPQDARNDAAPEAPVQGPIYYTLDSAQLTPDSQRILDQLAEQLRRHPAWRVQLEGHTCELGTAEYNLDLGQKRAASAKTYLERLGVSGKQLSTLSYGEERPAVSGEDEDARSKNRRTEFALVDAAR